MCARKNVMRSTEMLPSDLFAVISFGRFVADRVLEASRLVDLRPSCGCPLLTVSS